MDQFTLVPLNRKDGYLQYYDGYYGQNGVRCSRFRPGTDTSLTTLDIKDVEVGSSGGWEPFSEWIGRVYELNTVTLNITQQQWWESTGLSFRFLEMPGELRENIYAQITGPYLWPSYCYTHFKGWFLRYLGWQNDSELSNDGRPFQSDPSGGSPPKHSNNVAVSKQIRGEFLDFAFRVPTMHFMDRHEFPMAMQENITARIRHVSLGWSNHTYFQFLGMSTGPSPPFTTQLVQAAKPPICVLTEFPTLQSLNLAFYIREDSDGYNFDPFSALDGQLRGSPIGTSCQKTMVDWILTLAHGYVRHIPRITLSGHVKNSTRTKWEGIYDDERKGIRHDMSAAVARILSPVPSQNIPPKCFCMPTCLWWKEHGPYQEGQQDPNFSDPPMPKPSDRTYNPRKHNRFKHEG